MTDRYENIRKALAMGPTPGPWELKDGRTDTIENAQGYPVCTVHYHPHELYGHGVRAAYIAACDPDTIRELLSERDQLADALTAQAQEIERLREIAKGVEAERLWIDAKERLPQEGQRVVCEYKTGEVWAGRYRKAIRCERWMPIDRAIEGAKP